MSNCVACTDLKTLDLFHGDYERYDNFLYYKIYLQQLTKPALLFNNKQVKFKKFPIECEKEQAYFHLTTKAASKDVPLSNREPDLRRCERLHWIRPIIETNHMKSCTQPCFLCFEEEINGKNRINLFNKEERYLIVLEDRTDYFLLITAFYIDTDYYLKSIMKRYARSVSKK